MVAVGALEKGGLVRADAGSEAFGMMGVPNRAERSDGRDDGLRREGKRVRNNLRQAVCEAMARPKPNSPLPNAARQPVCEKLPLMIEEVAHC
jgi:hypothetical protein